MNYLKAERIGSSKWRVLALPYGGPFGGKDLDKEFFSPRTDPYGPYKGLIAERPVVFHHGGDEMLKDTALGVQDDIDQEEDGWWGTVWLDRSNRYWEQVNHFLQAGKMHGSSGAVGHFVKKDRKTGEILVWPHIEQTLTPTPANPFSRIVPVKAVDHFESLGIDLPPGFSDLGSAPADLGPDLPSGGDTDQAMQDRLRGDVANLLAKAILR